MMTKPTNIWAALRIIPNVHWSPRVEPIKVAAVIQAMPRRKIESPYMICSGVWVTVYRIYGDSGGIFKGKRK